MAALPAGGPGGRSPRTACVLTPDATSRARPRPVGAARGAGIVADGRRLRRVPRIHATHGFVRPYKPPTACSGRRHTSARQP
ncbi:hypothetical protein FCH28_17765 [Streptomyces piniterrae]|uniref:Uncharacterized protein n=1 Tax=Streptomyces piniterrae TaxID=2571125 RepID=A0A4U0NFU1_9ACTN|nr:hypothetical protein FCH28_17765 [Streptomyces piniterrae]